MAEIPVAKQLEQSDQKKTDYILNLKTEELILIMEKIADKRSFALVSKDFLRARCISLRRLMSSIPSSLLELVLPASPNLVAFTSSAPLQNSHLKLLAKSCPKLQRLNLGREREIPPAVDDFDDDGVIELVACKNIEEITLTRRMKVGDSGLISLVRSSRSLQHLDLEGCINITDETLKVIGELTDLKTLDLKGCSLITDLGLKYLADGEVRNCLNTLFMSNCGMNITDAGIVAICQIKRLRVLDLSMLANVTDLSLVQISKCTEMDVLFLNGCVAISGNGLRVFLDSRISELELVNCPNISWEDVVSVASVLASLEYVTLDRRMKDPMPAAGEQDFKFEQNFVKVVWK